MSHRQKKKLSLSLPVIPSKPDQTSNLNQDEIELVDRLAREHNSRVFGYLDEEDLYSEIWQICLKALPEYNSDKGPLENFLRKTVKNRLTNRFKDVTKSVRSPCPRCPYYSSSAPGHCTQYGEDRHDCNKWRNYQRSIESRNALLNAVEPEEERFYNHSPLTKIELDEMKTLIRSNLPYDLLADFDSYMSTGKLQKHKFRVLNQAIKEIVKDYI